MPGAGAGGGLAPWPQGPCPGSSQATGRPGETAGTGGHTDRWTPGSPGTRGEPETGASALRGTPA
eukprot:5068691-Alexandrium_andersonii.AAC.1